MHSGAFRSVLEHTYGEEPYSQHMLFNSRRVGMFTERTNGGGAVRTPTNGKQDAVVVRCDRPLLSKLDGWIGAQPKPKPTRPDAIRRLLEQALGDKLPVAKSAAPVKGSKTQLDLEKVAARLIALECLIRHLLENVAVMRADIDGDGEGRVVEVLRLLWDQCEADLEISGVMNSNLGLSDHANSSPSDFVTLLVGTVIHERGG
jgi:hypothetical protein